MPNKKTGRGKSLPAITLAKISAADLKRAIQKKKDKREVAGKKNGFNVIAIEGLDALEKALSALHDKKSYYLQGSFLVKVDAKHWTSIHFEKSGADIQFFVFDAARASGFEKVIPILQKLFSKPPIYVSSGGVQRDGQNCLLFAWDACCQITKIQGLFAQLAVLSEENEAGKKEDSIEIPVHLLPARIIRNMQSEDVFKEADHKTLVNKRGPLAAYIAAFTPSSASGRRKAKKKPAKFKNDAISTKVHNNFAKHLGRAVRRM